MSDTIKTIVLLAFGFFLGFAIQAYAAKPTDVRVGPTAAIGVSTNSDGTIVFVANGNGIFKSEDGGESWKQVY